MLALRAGVNIHPQGAGIDESFIGEQPTEDLTEEELLQYKQSQAPPPPNADQ